MKLVIALGGNALLKRGEPMTAETQRLNVRRAAVALATLVGDGHQIVVTHGNGPQVGLIALQAAAGPPDGAYPLDILGAESEGMIGYLIEQELRNLLPNGALLATLLTQTRVDAADPALLAPAKPIGPTYDETTAHRLGAERGWHIARDGAAWRRVVASPAPLEILVSPIIRMLVDHGVVVICAGGGGIPVVAQPNGDLVGIEAVIDKDHASELLARELAADMLLLLTDVDAVRFDFGTPREKRIARAGSASLVAELFPPGSMRPKIEAAKRFTTASCKPAAIGRLEDAGDIIRGTTGTRIEFGNAPVEFWQ